MADNPYKRNTLKCLNKQPTCEDCRVQDPDKISSAHFTICQKPWTCPPFDNPRNSKPCAAIHRKWFALRDEFERSLGLDLSYRIEKTRHEESLGMCAGFGDKKYIPIPLK